MLGLGCYERASSSCDKWGLLFDGVRGLLIVIASLVVVHRLQYLHCSGLAAPRRVVSPQTRDPTRVLCVCWWILFFF